uniref:Uncharacterized protein n=1 Tax=Anguilla anguilla TaxID=7936 RepID=A0A0E9XE08_ANGAN
MPGPAVLQPLDPLQGTTYISNATHVCKRVNTESNHDAYILLLP